MQPQVEKEEVIVFNEVPQGETTIWAEIGTEVLKYAVDIFDCFVDSLSSEDELEVAKALLSNKELLKNLLDATFIGKIEADDVRNELLEMVENVTNVDDIGDEVLGDVAGVLFKALTQQPELCGEAISTLLKYSPQLVLMVVTGNCGDKIPGFKLLLGVFEVSAERFWNLGEAFAEYSDAINAVEESLVARYENLVLHNYKFYGEVTKLALEDKQRGEYVSLKEVRMCENTMVGIRDEIRTSIDDKLDFWFRFFHSQKAKHLEEIVKELDALEFDYTEYYLDVMEE